MGKEACQGMKTIVESPVLQSTAKSGKAKFWQAVVFTGENDTFYYKKIWWQEGSKKQESVPVLVTQKNVGRSNETNAEAQAITEFDSIVKKQRDKGYSEDGSADHIPTKPMLANKYKDKKKYVTYPCYVQPKFDGFRMLKEADGTEAWTRGGKLHVQECVKHLMWRGEFMADGELILPPFVVDGKQKFHPLQHTAAAAKKFRADTSPTLLYCVYDIVAPDKPFSERYEILQEMALDAPDQVVVVETILVQNEEELFEAHSHFVAEGYEGTIIRSGDGGYEIGHRSNTLLKLKNFFDGEYKIVGAKEGKGSFEGKCCFICVTDEGKEFSVNPEGTMEYRAHLWETRVEHIGKWLTVRYYSVTDDGKPSHATGIDFREEGEF